jgi:uncharacterized protein
MYLLFGLGGFGDPTIISSLIFMAISGFLQMRLQSKFKQYSQEPLSSGLTGKEVAEKMLRENGITDVQVIHTPGMLTDHYNPANKTVNLSDAVYQSNTVAAAAVSAHECGHAIQHATAYSMLQLRSKLVPAVSISSRLMQFVIMGGLAVLAFTNNPYVLLGGIILFAVTTLFSIITLPVEFDASKRALAWLQKTNVTNASEQPKAKDALKWAALTYVAAALGSLVTLLQYVFIFLNATNRNRE